MFRELVVGQPLAEIAVRLDGRVNAHAFHCREQPRGEAVLHQRLTTRKREAAVHRLEPIRVFAHLLDRACSSGTGMPFLSVQVSGLWQYWQRNIQAVVQATSRMPGPSTAEPVVKECRKPRSPVLSALRTSVSGTPSPRCTRISNGDLASSGRVFSRHRRCGMKLPSHSPWKVRLITSICCSRVSRTKFTA